MNTETRMTCEPLKTGASRRRKWLALLAAVPFVMVAAAPTRAGDLPPAEVLLDKHVEATGGEKAHRAVESRVKRGKLAVDMAGHAFEADVTEQYVAPGKSHSLIEGGFFAQVDVCDGEHAWRWSPGHSDGTGSLASGTTELMEGAELAKLLGKARFYSALEWRTRVEHVETVGAAEVDGSPAWEVAMTTKDGRTSRQFYDEATGRLVKRIATTSSSQGEIDMEVSYQDYREFDGIWYATRIHTVLELPDVGTGTQTWTFTEVDHEAKIPASLFEMPDSLRTADKAAH
jgi:hypothetical protein